MMNHYEIHVNTGDDQLEHPYLVVYDADFTWEPCAAFATEELAKAFIRGARCAERIAKGWEVWSVEDGGPEVTCGYLWYNIVRR